MPAGEYPQLPAHQFGYPSWHPLRCLSPDYFAPVAGPSLRPGECLSQPSSSNLDIFTIERAWFGMPAEARDISQEAFWDIDAAKASAEAVAGRPLNWTTDEEEGGLVTMAWSDDPSEPYYAVHRRTLKGQKAATIPD